MVIAIGVEHAGRAAMAQREVTNMTNKLLEANAKALHQGSVDVARESERGIVDMETLIKTNQELIKALDEVSFEIEKGEFVVVLGAQVKGKAPSKSLRLRLEKALEIAETMIRSGALDIVIIDSVAALVPKAEIDGDMGDSHVGLQARLMSQALRKLTAVISKSNCTVVFINQLREKVGVMFGNPETTTGGRALKFYSSVRMDVRRIEAIKQNGENIGNRTRVKVVKNKIAPPFKEAEFDIMFGKGISMTGDVLDLAASVDIVNKSGAWYQYEGDKIGQGRENAKLYLENNPQVLAEIDAKVRAHFGLPVDGAKVAPKAAETEEKEPAKKGRAAKAE